MGVISLETFVDALGGAVPHHGTLSAWSSRVRVDGSKVVAPKTIIIRLVNGLPDTPIDLESLGVDEYWTLSLTFPHLSEPITRTVIVPDTDTTWENLIDVDPDTLEPTPGNLAGWDAAIAAVQTYAELAHDASEDAVTAKLAAQAGATIASGAASKAANYANITTDKAAQVAEATDIVIETAGHVNNDATSASQAAADTAQARLEALGFATSASDSQIAAAASATSSDESRVASEAAANVALTGQFAGTSVGPNTDLDTVNTPGVYRVGSQPKSGALHVPSGGGGILVVFDHLNGYGQQEFTPHSTAYNRGKYIRSRTASVWGDWRFIPSQRVDTSAGLAVYTWDDVNNREQMVYGDTGKRRVEHLFENGWIASLATVRRIGNVVEFAAYGLRGQEATGNGIFVLPTGFRDNATNAADLIVLREPLVTVNYTTGRISSTARGGSYAFRISLLTVDPWPTILPGNLG